MSDLGLLLVGLAIVVGLVGVVIPLLPGVVLVFGSILVWAIAEGGAAAWGFFALATAILAVSQVVKYLLPGRRMTAAGVPTRSLLLGALAGIVGFFVIPVLGLLVGFVGGVYVAERQRLGDHARAWPSTMSAVKAVGLSILIELAGCLLAGASWLAAVLFVV